MAKEFFCVLIRRVKDFLCFVSLLLEVFKKIPKKVKNKKAKKNFFQKEILCFFFLFFFKRSFEKTQKEKFFFVKTLKKGKMAEWVLRQFGRLVPLKDCWFNSNFFRNFSKEEIEKLRNEKGARMVSAFVCHTKGRGFKSPLSR